MDARFDDLVAGVAWRFGPPHELLVASRSDEVAGLLSAVHGATEAGAWAYGYVAFDAAPAFDPALVVRGRSEQDPPLAWFALCDPPDVAAPVTSPAQRPPRVSWQPEWDVAGFERRVEEIREAIAAGQVYQCNLTTRLRGRIADPAAFYAALACAQGGAYNALLDLGTHLIASASPELFFEWTDDGLRTRPMKGTAPRGTGEPDDRAHRERLLGSAKERAENVMIVDLLRNDLSRIARVGSVRVPALLRAERYETLWQLTSDVTAEPLPGTTLTDVFAALFPPGSVTGAPKTSAMRLIAELETSPRGVYCGAIGMVAPPGSQFRARFNVAIRTLVTDLRDGSAVYGTGSGITWSSQPSAEHAETLLKTAILTGPGEPVRLLETMRFEPGSGVRNLDRHLRRLGTSARSLGFAFDGPDVRARLSAELAGRDAGPLRVRLLLSRDGGVEVQHAELDPSPAKVRLAVDPVPSPPADVWCAHKTTRRQRYEAAAARCPDVDDVVLIDAEGRVVETTRANLAVRLDGRWWTPPVGSGCLPGVERGRLLETGELAERELTIADLRGAEALAVVSSLRGWRPAVLS